MASAAINSKKATDVKAKMADLALQPNTRESMSVTEDMGKGVKRTTFYAKGSTVKRLGE